MKDQKKIIPPRWASRLLEWYCKPALLEDLQGDLNEYFERHCRSLGARRAKLLYVIDVFKFIRSYTIRKPEFINLLLHWIMLGSYVKTSTRTIVRHKLFSSINIIGLAVSMSVGLLVIAFISNLLSYDNFHEKKDRIYRVTTHDQRQDQPPMSLACTSVKAGKKIQETFTGVESLTMLRRGFGGDAAVDENILPISGLWADQSFFTVFSFPLLQGDPATALKEPYSLVLTEKSAKKMFGEADPLGRSVKLDTMNYVVTGVAKDIPKLSHMRFDALASFSTLELQKPSEHGDGDFLSWENIYMTYVYLVLPENGSGEIVQSGLDKLATAENSVLNKRKITLELQPLNGILIGKNLANPVGPMINRIAVWVLGGLAFVVILSACFNYTNLSIARSLRRSREVGIRKVIGAQKGNVLAQFMVESVIISLLALIFSFLLFLFLRTQFLSIHPFLADLLSLELSLKLIGWFVVLSLAVGMLAGFLPAIFFSRINAIQVLKDMSSLKVFRHVNMRKALIVVQYSFSLIFITTTIIGYNQYKSFLTFDLGFTTENILNIKLQGNKGDQLIKELSELPFVGEVSKSRIVTSIGSMYGTQMKYNGDSSGVWLNFVDEHYLPLHKHAFVAGNNFSILSENAAERQVIVNEQVIKRFNIANSDPHQALGEQIELEKGKKLTITGVLKDFHYGTLEDKIQPMLFQYSSDEPGGYVNVKITAADFPTAMANIEKAWKKIDQVHALDAAFYDDQIQQNYSQFSVMVKVIGFLAFLAVCIASMGLFGMVVFTTETRLKEISIRKVLGASEGKLIYLLSKGFVILLTVAAAVALPATYLFFDKIVLVQFTYHQPIGIGELGIGAVAVILLAVLMIGVQTFKVARSNPAQVLKVE
jgi:putative ABC transport system permease protein